MSPTNHVPPPIRRPALARWIWERGLTWRQAGDYFGMSGEGLRIVCLPFSNRRRQIPRRDLMAQIYERTGGEITPDTFHDLSPAPADAGADLAAAH
ncbi:MAG: hypothetical protein AB1760_10150 [Pseudomonadota bacterium]